MSMIEKFLKEKEATQKDLDKIRDEVLEIASVRANDRLDNFIAGFKVLVAEASDDEFVEFITSGKLSDDDIMAAIAFRGEAGKISSAKPFNDKSGIHVHVIVLD